MTAPKQKRSVLGRIAAGAKIRVESLRLSPLARRVRAERLTYLSPARLLHMEECLQRLRTEHIPGDLLEAGVALGGSAIVLASRLDDTPGIRRRFRGYDVFGMIPAPSDRDGADAHGRYAVISGGQSTGIAGDDYYGYQTDLERRVVANFERHSLAVDGDRIRLVAGLFQDTLVLAESDVVAFAHVDCDWYDPVRLCLERIGPKLATGGLLLLDDYGDYEGCRKAVHDVLDRDATLEIVSLAPNAILRKR